MNLKDSGEDSDNELKWGQQKIRRNHCGSKQNKYFETLKQCLSTHDIQPPHWMYKILKSHFFSIIYGCMISYHGKKKLNRFWILLDICKCSTIGTGNIKLIFKHKQYITMTWKTQEGNFTTTEKVKFNYV